MYFSLSLSQRVRVCFFSQPVYLSVVFLFLQLSVQRIESQVSPTREGEGKGRHFEGSRR